MPPKKLLMSKIVSLFEVKHCDKSVVCGWNVDYVSEAKLKNLHLWMMYSVEGCIRFKLELFNTMSEVWPDEILKKVWKN